MGISALAFDSQLLIPWNQDRSQDTLVLTSTGSPDVDASLPPDTWSRYSASYREAKPSHGVFVQADYKVTFSSLTFTAFVPKPGDRAWWDGLTCSGVVTSVQQNDFMQYYDLTVRDLVLSYDLRSECTVQRPTVAPDGSGLRSMTLADLYSDVPCALQPEAWQQETLTDDQLIRRQSYTIYLLKTAAAPDIVLKAGDVVTVDGVIYEVTGQQVVIEYDTLVTVSVERKDP